MIGFPRFPVIANSCGATSCEIPASKRLPLTAMDSNRRHS